MARLASDSKMGFYPTSPKSIKKVINYIDIPTGTMALDPCCGTGEALSVFGDLGCKTYGVELDELRAQEAVDTLDVTLNADALSGVRKSLNWAGVLFLNPPYGVNSEQKRLEVEFVQRWGNVVKLNGGVLVLVINPSSADEKMAQALVLNGYKPIFSAYDPDGTDYKKFGQFFVVLQRQSYGYRHDKDDMLRYLEHQVDVADVEVNINEVPVGNEPDMFKEIVVPDWKLDEMLAKSNLQHKMDLLLITTSTGNGSIEHPNEGQAALLVASGVLNKAVGNMILKGKVVKSFVETPTYNGKGEIMSVTKKESWKTIVYGLDKRTLEFVKMT